MQVKLIADMSGARDGELWPAKGTVLALPDDEALALVNGQLAEFVETPTAAHAAPVEPVAPTA